MAPTFGKESNNQGFALAGVVLFFLVVGLAVAILVSQRNTFFSPQAASRISYVGTVSKLANCNRGYCYELRTSASQKYLLTPTSKVQSFVGKKVKVSGVKVSSGRQSGGTGTEILAVATINAVPAGNSPCTVTITPDWTDDRVQQALDGKGDNTAGCTDFTLAAGTYRLQKKWTIHLSGTHLHGDPKYGTQLWIAPNFSRAQGASWVIDTEVKFLNPSAPKISDVTVEYLSINTGARLGEAGQVTRDTSADTVALMLVDVSNGIIRHIRVHNFMEANPPSSSGLEAQVTFRSSDASAPATGGEVSDVTIVRDVHDVSPIGIGLGIFVGGGWGLGERPDNPGCGPTKPCASHLPHDVAVFNNHLTDATLVAQGFNIKVYGNVVDNGRVGNKDDLVGRQGNQEFYNNKVTLTANNDVAACALCLDPTDGLNIHDNQITVNRTAGSVASVGIQFFPYPPEVTLAPKSTGIKLSGNQISIKSTNNASPKQQVRGP